MYSIYPCDVCVYVFCIVYVYMYLYICLYNSIYNRNITLRAAALDIDDTLNRKYVWNFFFNIMLLIQNQDIMQFNMY